MAENYYIHPEQYVPRSRRKRKRFNPIPIILLIIFALAVVFISLKLLDHKKEIEAAKESESASIEASMAESVEESIAESIEEENRKPVTELLGEAALLASQYDYSAAVKLLKSEEKYAEDEEVLEAIYEYDQARASLVRQNIYHIPHIFFHTLVYDESLAFDGDTKSKGYNQVMTTVDEFKEICQEMYDRGYVLVSLHDMTYEKEDPETGKMKMYEGDIYLPEGKKAFVMSQDDVCYYEYMRGDGMATRMIVGKDGRPVTEYKDKDGNVSVGAYDLVPILDEFIDEHPDFSYHGHKATLCFTGYNGILGYRTDETYDPASELYDSTLADAPNENIEEDRKEAVRVLKALVDDGYDLASHSWGHRDMGADSVSHLKYDADRWDKNVNSLIKEATGNACDILIFPKGADIGDWRPYDSSNKKEGFSEKYKYLYELGFRYYCNVDSNQPWVQLTAGSLRQGRINIDGDRMWRDIANPDTAKLSDFIDVNKVFYVNTNRPTPVPAY